MDLVGMNKFANNLAVPILMLAHTDGADLGQVGIGQTEEGRAMARCPAPENHPRFFVAMIFGGLYMLLAASLVRFAIAHGDVVPLLPGFFFFVFIFYLFFALFSFFCFFFSFLFFVFFFF